MLGVMLLYVGAVLVVNGIWLIGQTGAETSALYIQNREVSVLNLFTGFVGLNLFQSAFTNWCPMMTILRKIGGGQILTAENGAKVATNRGLGNPTFFVSGTSKDPGNATKIIESFTTEEYQKSMTAAMRPSRTIRFQLWMSP